jgi:hypothetical protein
LFSTILPIRRHEAILATSGISLLATTRSLSMVTTMTKVVQWSRRSSRNSPTHEVPWLMRRGSSMVTGVELFAEQAA